MVIPPHLTELENERLQLSYLNDVNNCWNRGNVDVELIVNFQKHFCSFTTADKFILFFGLLSIQKSWDWDVFSICRKIRLGKSKINVARKIK